MKAAVTALLCALLIFITLPAKAAGSCGSGAEILTVDEILLMAKVMELENGCNSDLCLMLTGSVILNRRSSPEWPDTVQGVIYQKGQYADWTLRHIPDGQGLRAGDGAGPEACDLRDDGRGDYLPEHAPGARKGEIPRRHRILCDKEMRRK